jgi:CubicO group peptidase (beta-lactamase class C family)
MHEAKPTFPASHVGALLGCGIGGGERCIPATSDQTAPMGRRRILLAAAAALVLAACSGTDPADDAEAGERAAPSAGPTEEAAAIFDGIGPGDPFCTAAVLRGDEVVWAQAYGSDDDGPITIDTEVDLASTSKQFTGVAIELLVDRGDLAGDDLVGDLVPASSPATDDVEVDELLTHTSGLIDYTELLDAEDDDPTTQADAVAAIAATSPTDVRGTFDYSNSNYVLLAEVVEAVTGSPLPEFLDEEVFGPLGLAMALDPRSTWAQVGDGSVWTTPTELVRWSRQYWDQTLDGPDLASTMFDPEVDASEGEDDEEVTYGSGILRTTTDDGGPLLFHDGSWDGYETDWIVLPDDELAAAVTCDEDATPASDAPADDLLAIWQP